MGNPWLSRQINAYLTDTRVLPEPGIHERMAVMLRHIDRTIQYKGERTAMMEARHHAAYYTKGLRGGAGFRRRICQMSHFEGAGKAGCGNCQGECRMIFKNVTFYNEVFQKDVADIQVENGRITAIGVLEQEGSGICRATPCCRAL